MICKLGELDTVLIVVKYININYIRLAGMYLYRHGLAIVTSISMNVWHWKGEDAGHRTVWFVGTLSTISMSGLHSWVIMV